MQGYVGNIIVLKMTYTVRNSRPVLLYDVSGHFTDSVAGYSHRQYTFVTHTVCTVHKQFSWGSSRISFGNIL